ncbi:hypothetical protein HYS54_02410 [Candidatus Micrarchaeota archaeon]|nr:hypothetical protein [Candidatus Micrarchaeota archaeon]
MVNYAALAIIAVLSVAVGFASFDYFTTHTQYRTIEEQVYGKVAVQLAAVDEEDNGLMLPMTVEVKPGSGKVLINIDNPSFILDTQESMRVAVREAAKISRADQSSIDVLFSINGGQAQIVGGPSAGAAMAVAASAAMMNKRLREGVVVSGTIEEGGDIGPVGGLLPKAKAAKSVGTTLFIVPRGQAYQNEPVETCTSEVRPDFRSRYCTVTYKTTSLADVAGIEVKEASTLADALQLAIQEE